MGTCATRRKAPSMKVVSMMPQADHPWGMSSRHTLKRRMCTCTLQRRFGRQEKSQIYYRYLESSRFP